MMGDRVVSFRWQWASDTDSAFINEYLDQLRRGVGNANTYNKIWSPGRKSYTIYLNKFHGGIIVIFTPYGPI